jgi:hypothetical protein
MAAIGKSDNLCLRQRVLDLPAKVFYEFDEFSMSLFILRGFRRCTFPHELIGGCKVAAKIPKTLLARREPVDDLSAFRKHALGKLSVVFHSSDPMSTSYARAPARVVQARLTHLKPT